MSRLLAVSLAFAGAAACGDPLGPFAEEAGWEFGLNATGLVVSPGDTLQMHALAHRSGGKRYSQPTLPQMEPWPSEHPLRWWSSDTTIMQVSADGVIRGLRQGRASIWIESGGRRDSAAIWVNADPQPIRTYESVAVGNAHACALDSYGQSYCWGWDLRAQLGRKVHRKFIRSPTALAVSGGAGFLQVSAAPYHNCGLSVEGVAYCWGGNFWGQLGTGERWTGGKVPVSPIPVTPAVAVTFRFLVANGGGTCGLDHDGHAWCWGDGALAIDPEADATLPQRVRTDLAFTSIVPGDHTCALTAAGKAFCWGWNSDGQLGVSCGSDCPDGPLPVETELRFTAIDVGGQFTCGLTARGEVYCWGELSTGEPSWVPHQVPALPPIRKISAGLDHACALAEDGRLSCWGSDFHAQLGSDAVAEMRFRDVSAGGQNTCAVGLDGYIYCWGRNSHGQVGDGTLEYWKPDPVRVIDW